MQNELQGKKLPELRAIAESLGVVLPKKFLKKDELLTLIESAAKGTLEQPKPTRQYNRKAKSSEEVSSTEPSNEKSDEPQVEQQSTETSTESTANQGEEVTPRRPRRPRKNKSVSAEESNSEPSNSEAQSNTKNSSGEEANQATEGENPQKSPRQRTRRDRHGNDHQGAEHRKEMHNRGEHHNENRRKGGDRVNAQVDFTGTIECVGSLEMVPDGYGFLRSADYNYINSPDDVYVSAGQIKQHGLKQGDTIMGIIRPPREGDKFFPLTKITRINGLTPEEARDRIQFEFLTPLFPEEKFNITGGGHNNISNRIVDMFSPIGKGQRALIVAQPKTGKTILLKDLANAIADNHPDVYMIMLLIDERPEEVTDMARSVKAEVIASTFDEQAAKHVKVAEMVLEKAKRLVECGHDVVIMLDSITRLARAYNTVQPSSNKILSGGVDAAALHKPKRFFGAARNTEERGSLTIIATALIETGSKMDEVIFEEFKGTGNMELQLDRKLSNRRIYPAVDITASSTRRDDLLQDKDLQQKMWILRRHLSDMTSIEAMEFVKKHLEGTRSNDEFFKMMNQ